VAIVSGILTPKQIYLIVCFIIFTSSIVFQGAELFIDCCGETRKRNRNAAIL